MNTTLFKQFQDFRTSLNQSFLEREVIIDGLLASLLTRQNAFLFGPPGSGKSELVRAVSSGFMGTKFFGYLLSPTTDPSELFGPVAVSKLLKDEYTRDIKGYLPDSNIAFLDELFRGSSAVLNSLLTILNERSFNNGKDIVRTPIHSIVAATNSFPQEESLQAFCDRFLFRPTVNLLKKPASKVRLYNWTVGEGERRPTVSSRLTLDDLRDLQDEADKVRVCDGFLDTFSGVIEMLDSRGISISDRRAVQLLKFLKGWAVVQGEDMIYPDMLIDTIPHIVYQKPDDLIQINEVLSQVIQTPEAFHKESKEALVGVMREFSTLNSVSRTDGDMAELNRMVAAMKRCLNDIINIEDKVKKVLESPGTRIKMTSRTKLSSLLAHCEMDKQSVTKSINNICG